MSPRSSIPQFVNSARPSIVSIAEGLNCPHCHTEVRACDVDLPERGVRTICRRCHRDIFIVEPVS
jgi:hypothetical protein